MCRYIRTLYSCGHKVEISIPSNDRCFYTQCLRLEWVEKDANQACEFCPARRRGTNHGAEDRPADNETVRSDYTHPRYDEGSPENEEPSFNPFFGQAGLEHEDAYRRSALIAFRRRNDIEREQWDRYYGNLHLRRAENGHVEGREFCGCEHCNTQRRVDMNNRQVDINNRYRRRDEEEYDVDEHREPRRSSQRSGQQSGQQRTSRGQTGLRGGMA